MENKQLGPVTPIDWVNSGAGTVAGTAGTKKDALTYLQTIYNDPLQPTSTRMRAAIAVLNYETPRLMVTAQVNDQSFAEVLERRLKKYQELQRANGSKQIEAKAEPAEPEPIEVKPPTPTSRYRVFNRRF
jgi:hypothetical protein